MERYRSGYNGPDSKDYVSLVSSCQKKQGISRLFRCNRSHFHKICLPVILHFSGSGKNPVFTAYRRLNIKLIKYLWSGIEAVITALTRNQVYQQWYRGFESHPLRQRKSTARSVVFFRWHRYSAGGIRKGRRRSRHKQSGGLFVSPRENLHPLRQKPLLSIWSIEVFVEVIDNVWYCFLKKVGLFYDNKSINL